MVKNFYLSTGDIQAYFGDETIKKPISNKGDVIISKYFSIDLKIQPQLAYLSILGSGLVILLLGIPGFFFNYPIEIRERDYLKIIPIFFGLPIALIGLFFLKISKNIKKWTFMLIGGIGVLFSVYVIIFGSPYIYTVAILFISSVLYLISTLGFIEQENNSKADLSSNSISLTSDKLSSHKTTEIIQFIKRNVKIISISFSIVVLIVITIFAFSIFNRTDRLIIGKDFSMTWEEFNVNKDCSLQSGGIWARAGECQEQFSNCRPGVCSKGDCKNGYGKMNFPSGGFFLGNFKDGEFTGSYNIQLSCEANSVYYGETLNSQINGKVYILRPTLDKKYPNLKCITVTAAIYKNDRFLYVETETEECFHKGVGEVKFQIAGSKGFFYK
jgi:hypothetical protein